MLNEKLAKEILNISIETGCDFAELYYEDTFTQSLMVENGLVDSIGTSVVNGVGLRLLKNYKCVYGYTNDVTEKGLKKLAYDLRASFDSKQELEKISGFSKVITKNFHKKCTSLVSVSKEEIVNLLKKINAIVKDYDNRIVKVNTGFLITTNKVTIYNSKEKVIKNSREYGRIFISSIGSDNGKIETRYDGPGSQGGWEYFTKTLNLENLAKEHAEKLILMLGAKECPSGKYPVIIGNGWGGVIFHEACGHQLEASCVGKGLSVFSNKLGEKIANDCVSAYDDGTIPNEWGSNLVDDEGNVTNKNLLIENGVLKGYLIDDFTGRRMNLPGNGACRRQSYKYTPTSRMSNTYIAPGKYTPEEIIKNTKLGLYAVSFGGGSVNPATGEFNFGCSEAYIIKNGKILEPVRGATLVGKATEILKHIDMVGNDLAFGQGNCGASSGSIPVDVGQPTIRVDEITVGGRGGSINEYK